jgi:hypothetical protein
MMKLWWNYDQTIINYHKIRSKYDLTMIKLCSDYHDKLKIASNISSLF